MKKNGSKQLVFLAAGCACALISSLAFFVNHLLSRGVENVAVSIVTSIEFWLFFLAEVVIFLLIRNRLKFGQLTREYRDLKIWRIFLVIFAVCTIIFILITIIYKGVETTFGMLMLSFGIFAFQMIFITKSKFFNIIVGERKDCEK